MNDESLVKEIEEIIMEDLEEAWGVIFDQLSRDELTCF